VGASWGVEGSGEEASVKAMLDARDAAHAEQLERVSEELRTEVPCMIIQSSTLVCDKFCKCASKR
jgi:hypothetical protein